MLTVDENCNSSDLTSESLKCDVSQCLRENNFFFRLDLTLRCAVLDVRRREIKLECER